MRGMLAYCLLAGWAALNETAGAQVISGGESERGLRPGYNVPYDGMSYNERYSYSTGSFFYPMASPRSMIYQDYYDRLDRAYKFGYPVPREPWAPDSPYYRTLHRPPARGGIGLGLGFFRWR